MDVFTDAFRRVSAEDIVGQVRAKGYFAFERALDEAAADAVVADVDDFEVRINRNVPPNVVHKGATFATHVLARSRTAFQIVTDRLVTEVLKGALGEEFSMVGKRAYETRSGAYMCFHSDTARAQSDAAQIDALVFIFYLNDVAAGEWEIVEGSHLWGEPAPPSRDYDRELAERPDATIRGFRMPKGSVIVYNGRLLHRATPYESDSFARRSLFFQTNRGPKKGEPILIETGFITPDLSEDAKMLLGFGKRPRVPAFPDTSDVHLPQAGRKLAEDAGIKTPA